MAPRVRCSDCAITMADSDGARASNSNVRKDHRIGPQATNMCSREIRLMSCEERPSQFPTNHARLTAQTIAATVQNRSAVERFIKALKQNLKIRAFVVTSPTAVKTPVRAALIARLMLRSMPLRSRCGRPMLIRAAPRRTNLFAHRDRVGAARACLLRPARPVQTRTLGLWHGHLDRIGGGLNVNPNRDPSDSPGETPQCVR